MLLIEMERRKACPHQNASTERPAVRLEKPEEETEFDASTARDSSGEES
jgi:hypothetical protein